MTLKDARLPSLREKLEAKDIVQTETPAVEPVEAEEKVEKITKKKKK